MYQGEPEVLDVDELRATTDEDDSTGVGSFGVYHFALKGKQLVDKTLSVSIVLVDIQLDDLRPNRKSKITK